MAKIPETLKRQSDGSYSYVTDPKWRVVPNERRASWQAPWTVEFKLNERWVEPRMGYAGLYSGNAMTLEDAAKIIARACEYDSPEATAKREAEEAAKQAEYENGKAKVAAMKKAREESLALAKEIKANGGDGGVLADLVLVALGEGST